MRALSVSNVLHALCQHMACEHDISYKCFKTLLKTYMFD